MPSGKTNKNRNLLLVCCCLTSNPPLPSIVYNYHYYYHTFPFCPPPGTHWHHEIVYMLMNGSAQYTEVEDGADFIELVPIKKGYNPPDSQPRVFFTHLKLHHLPKQVLPLAQQVVSRISHWISTSCQPHRVPPGYHR